MKLALVAVAISGSSLPGQGPPIAVGPFEVAEHRAGRLVLRVEKPERPFTDGVEFEVAVDNRGRVILAKHVAGDDRWLLHAHELIQNTKYEPFMRRGKAVDAKFREVVYYIPQDVSQTKPPLPEIRDRDAMRIHFVRGSCYGPCPEYSVEIRGDGPVVYNGGANTTIVSKHRSSISPQDLESLLTFVRAADFGSLKKQYGDTNYDGPHVSISVTIGGTAMSAHDLSGDPKMPRAVKELFAAIDFYADTNKWVQGDAQTLAALKSEGFDFHSDLAATIFFELARRGKADLLRDFIPACAPFDKRFSQSLIAGAFRLDSQILKMLIAAGVGRQDAAAKSEALKVARQYDRTEAERLLIRYGAVSK